MDETSRYVLGFVLVHALWAVLQMLAWRWK
jgi:hypothetical protein